MSHYVVDVMRFRNIFRTHNTMYVTEGFPFGSLWLMRSTVEMQMRDSV